MDVIERLEDEIKPEQSEQGERWEVRTFDDASWASRKAARARAEIARIEAWRERETARLNNAADREIERLASIAESYESRLIEFLNREIQAGRPVKTLDLPGGVVSVRKAQAKVTLDESTFLAWAKRHAPEFVKTEIKEKPKLADLKKAAQLDESGNVILKSTGEIVEGASWTQPEPIAKFEPKELSV